MAIVHDRKHLGGWRSFLEWAVALGLGAFALLSVASIGMLVLPVALGALVVAYSRNRGWPEAPLGGLVGVASLFVIIALRGWGVSPCAAAPARMELTRGEHFACGGLADPVVWLALGLLLAGAGLAGYVFIRRTHRSPAA